MKETAALDEYARLLYLLSSMYLCKPTRESLVNWRQLLRDEPLDEGEELKCSLESINLDSEQELEDILWEYTRLFLGPYRLPCPPLESVYTSPKRLMRQDAFDAVGALYREAGLDLGESEVMYDHIGVELNFLAILRERMVASVEGASSAEELAGRFVAEHLKNWVPRFVNDLEGAAETRVFRALAQTTRRLVDAL